MDEQAALIARRVAMAAAAWFNAPADVEAYRRLSGAVGECNAYCAPTMEHPAQRADEEELVDQLADEMPPAPLGAGIDDLETAHRRPARDSLPPPAPGQGPRDANPLTGAAGDAPTGAGQPDEPAEAGH